MKKKYLQLITSILLLFLFSGCGEKEDEESKNNSGNGQKIVPVITIKESSLTPNIEISGTLEPKFQSTISAEASGVIREMYVAEGDEVSAGQNLLSFFENTNIHQIDFQNAQISLGDAERVLALTRKQVLESEENAKIAVRQAEENLANAERTDISTGSSIGAQISSSRSSVDLAIIAKENAEKNYEETKINLDKQEINLSQNKKNTISSAMNTFRKVLQDMDLIMGVNVETRKLNDRFETYLGFKDPQTKIDAGHSFRQVWNRFITLEGGFIKAPEETSIEDITTISEEIRESLQKIDFMLKKSVASGNFTETELSSFRTSTSAGRSSIETILASVTSISQQISDFEVTKPQQIRGSELAISQVKQQLVQAEKNLEQITSGGSVSKVGTENQISNAKNALETAKTQLKLVQKQNEIAVAQAVSARDSSANALRRAQIGANKLSTATPISGVVLEKRAETGDTVSMGTPLVVVGYTKTLILKGEIDAKYLSQIALGMKTKVTSNAFGEKEGVISRIYPTANESTRRIPLEISLENSNQKIPANIFATAVINFQQEDGVILIPQKVLISQDPPTVFIVGEGESGDEKILMTERREVILGRKQGNKIEVEAGLIVGEKVVAEPILALRSGDHVEILKNDEEGDSEEMKELTNEEAMEPEAKKEGVRKSTKERVEEALEIRIKE